MTPELRPLLDILIEHADVTAKPRGYKLGFRAVHPDFRSSRGFRWPFPGGEATSPKTPTKGGPCPSFEGDGLCIAKDAEGAASGGIPLSTVLIVAYRQVFGEGEHKVRVGKALVLDVVDVPGLARTADLSWANLSWANLTRADLTWAYLSRANLTGANLTRANLTGANLTWAYLSRADLTRADLTEANLTGANLTEADLTGAYLPASLTKAAAIERGAVLTP